MPVVDTTQQNLGSVSVYGERDLWSGSNFGSANFSNTNLTPSRSSMVTGAHGAAPSGNIQIHRTADLLHPREIGWAACPGSCLAMDLTVDAFADVNVNMDFDTDINWYNWVESAKGVDFNFGAAGNRLIE